MSDDDNDNDDSLQSTPIEFPPPPPEFASPPPPAHHLDQENLDNIVQLLATSAQPIEDIVITPVQHKRKHVDLIISNPPSKRANVSDDHVDPRWLTGDQIDVFLRTACKSKNQYRLTFAAASSLVFDGECRVGRTLLGRYRFVHGPVHSGKPRHLTTLFIDIDERRFIYINSLGTTQQATDDAFSNWLNYVAKRPDLKQLHEEKPFVNVVVDHPVQVDSYNCGAFVCKFILMLLNDEIINSNSFEPASMDSFRATILSDSM